MPPAPVPPLPLPETLPVTVTPETVPAFDSASPAAAPVKAPPFSMFTPDSVRFGHPPTGSDAADHRSIRASR
jgi:hypothetical protein